LGYVVCSSTSYLLVDHTVEDYDEWKPYFDDHASTRAESGSHGGKLFHKEGGATDLGNLRGRNGRLRRPGGNELRTTLSDPSLRSYRSQPRLAVASKRQRARVSTGTRGGRFYETGGDAGFYRTAQAFEEIAVDVLSGYKPDRPLETNVEFYTAILLDGVGVPKDLFTAAFAVSRVGGWMVHAREQLAVNRLIRPRARYVGETDRTWMPLEEQ
jgi:hypothetical protein